MYRTSNVRRVNVIDDSNSATAASYAPASCSQSRGSASTYRSNNIHSAADAAADSASWAAVNAGTVVVGAVVAGADVVDEPPETSRPPTVADGTPSPPSGSTTVDDVPSSTDNPILPAGDVPAPVLPSPVLQAPTTTAHATNTTTIGKKRARTRFTYPDGPERHPGRQPLTRQRTLSPDPQPVTSTDAKISSTTAAKSTTSAAGTNTCTNNTCPSPCNAVNKNACIGPVSVSVTNRA